MPRIHVLDVPEFSGLISTVRDNPAVQISASRGGYITISSNGDLMFDRKSAGFKPAIWYSCCSGGVDGTIVEFGRDMLRISSDQTQP